MAPTTRSRSPLTLTLTLAATLVLAACGNDDQAAAPTGGDAGPTSTAGADSNWLTLHDKDIVIGAADAPVTLIEYASVTCSACAAFHQTTYPQLKEKYIDTGKVRVIFREFPTSPPELAANGFLLARCAGSDEGYMRIVEALLKSQSDWVFNPNPAARQQAFNSIAGQAGIAGSRLEACLNDQDGIDHINMVSAEANQRYGVRSTPSFVINGQIVTGAVPLAELESVITPLLPAE